MAVQPLAVTRSLSGENLRSELKRARAQIASLEADRWHSHERLIDSLGEGLKDGFVLLSPEGIHLDVNSAFCEMVGYRREELIGVGMPHPYWPPEQRQPVARVLRDHLEGATETVEATFMRKGGERFPALLAPSVILGEDGQPFCLFATVKDISAQRRMEMRLRESEARYRTVLENTPIGIFQSTSEGQIIYVNPAYVTIFGYDSPAEMIASVNRQGVAETLYEEPLKHRQFVNDVHDSGGGWQIHENRYRRRDGSVFDGLLYFSERLEPESGAVNLFGFVQDVSAQKQAIKKLEHATALLSQGERLAHLGSWEWEIASDSCTVSPEWQRLHGLAGDRFSNDEILLTCHEDDRPAMQAALERAAAGKPYRVDHRIVRADSGEVRHLMTYGESLFDAEGHLETVIGASLDVTERRRADEVLSERTQRLQRALDATVTALGATVAMRDPYTANHERRVADLARRIAERLGFSEEAIATLHTAALVHDVGKIAIPAEILSKPTRLTEIEFALVKGHAAAAHEILAAIEFDGPVAEIVAQHHERLDGSGYPRGLRAAEILPAARVLAVADVVEAMITHRPYRAALPLAAALAEIGPQSHGRFDGAVAEVCRRLFLEEGYQLPD
ncbi:MAG: PAS domain S-box protein [Thermoleophilia bacterium]